MSEGNGIQYQLKNIYKRETRLNHFLSLDKIKILEEVNSIFIHQIIQEFSDFSNSDVKISANKIKIGFDYENKNIITPLMYYNILEILPCKNPFYAIFSPNMLFLMIDIIFGGKIKYNDYMYNKLDMTSTEYFINQKLIKLVIKVYSYSWKKFFLMHMKFMYVKKDIDMMQKKLSLNKLLITNHFVFSINDVEFYFYLFSPMSLFDMLIEKKEILSNINTDLNQHIVKKSSTENIHNISLTIVAKLASFLMTDSEISKLSIGDVLLIDNPETVFLYVDQKPVFLGKYNVFNGRTSILIEEFISSSIDYARKNKENINE